MEEGGGKGEGGTKPPTEDRERRERRVLREAREVVGSARASGNESVRSVSSSVSFEKRRSRAVRKGMLSGERTYSFLPFIKRLLQPVQQIQNVLLHPIQQSLAALAALPSRSEQNPDCPPRLNSGILDLEPC